MANKFQKFDHVRIAKDLGPSMSHFENDCEAIVLYSNAEKGSGSGDEYGLFIKGAGETAWYHEHQLTLIRENVPEVLDLWEDERKAKNARAGNLDLIFSDELTQSDFTGATWKALGKCMGINNLWGPSGEGIVYAANCSAILQYAAPFIVNNDKEGWLKFCEEYKAKKAVHIQNTDKMYPRVFSTNRKPE